MVSSNLIEQFLSQVNDINIFEVIVSLMLAFIMSYALKIIYVRFGRSLSNRKRFSDNFIILGLTTTLVISVIKSSLALSLGLVGSLSIIRFRTAIKDPEELAYLFLNIAVALGLGANKWLLTTITFVFICLVLIIRGLINKKDINENFHLIVSSKPSRRVSTRNIIRILQKHCESIRLKRFDKTEDNIEAAFLINLKSFSNLERIKDELENLSKSIKITYLDIDI